MSMKKVKGWTVGLAAIIALALGVLSGIGGDLGISRAEAASPEQFTCEGANTYEQFVVYYPWLGAPGWALVEEPDSDQFLGRTPGQCGNYTICGEFSDFGRQFPIPMAKWNSAEDCGSSGGAGLPSF